jgi:UDP-N-acetyl-D-mannosaminuronic acid dehydrogenase
LSFKADVDDLRGSPAVFIAKNICKFHTGKVLLVEPHLNKLPGMLNNHLSDVATALSLADIHVLLVDHTAFDAFFPTNGIIIDTRGMWRDH